MYRYTVYLMNGLVIGTNTTSQKFYKTEQKQPFLVASQHYNIMDLL